MTGRGCPIHVRCTQCRKAFSPTHAIMDLTVPVAACHLPSAVTDVCSWLLYRTSSLVVHTRLLAACSCSLHSCARLVQTPLPSAALGPGTTADAVRAASPLSGRLPKNPLSQDPVMSFLHCLRPGHRPVSRDWSRKFEGLRGAGRQAPPPFQALKASV